MSKVDSVARILALAGGDGSGSIASTTNYLELVNKPRINGIELVGNKSTAELGISLSGVETITGTTSNPIMVENLDLGVYVLSGTAQSNNTNTSKKELTKRVYSITRDNDKTVLWDENPYTKTQFYVVFYHTGSNEPLEGIQSIATEKYVMDAIGNAIIDGGTYE